MANAKKKSVFETLNAINDKVYYRVKFKRGLQVAYPNEIVEFTLAT